MRKKVACARGSAGYILSLAFVLLCSSAHAWERLGDVLPCASETECGIADVVMANDGATVGVSYSSGTSVIFDRSGNEWIARGDVLNGSIISLAQNGSSLVTEEGVFELIGADWVYLASKQENHSADGKTSFREASVNTYEILSLKDGEWEVAVSGPQGCQGIEDCHSGEGCLKYCIESRAYNIRVMSGDGSQWVVQNDTGSEHVNRSWDVGDWTLSTDNMRENTDPWYRDLKAMSHDGSLLAFSFTACYDFECATGGYSATNVFDLERNIIGTFSEGIDVVSLTSEAIAVYHPFPHLQIRRFSSGQWIAQGYPFDTSKIEVEAISEAGDLVLVLKEDKAWVCGLPSSIANSSATSVGPCDYASTGDVISHPRWMFELDGL